MLSLGLQVKGWVVEGTEDFEVKSSYIEKWLGQWKIERQGP